MAILVPPSGGIRKTHVVLMLSVALTSTEN